jgi:hypothetical protein
VKKAATRRPERQTSAVAAAGCFGGVINTSLQHLSHQQLGSHHSRWDIVCVQQSIEANNFMIIPIMPTVNNWLIILTLNPENVMNARLFYHAGVIEPRLCRRRRHFAFPNAA